MQDNPTLTQAVLNALQALATGEPKARTKGAARTQVNTPAPQSHSFFAQGELGLGALGAAIEGIGALGPQLTHEQAQALHARSTPAGFGHREATLQDTKVRHTGEIAADALTLSWASGALARLQTAVASGLGLPAVALEPHKVLVYGPGQFFKPHQDTQQHPNMVATLVVLWPAAHLGGDLVVRHGEQEARFTSQHLRAAAPRWFAFFADCRHEVLPVTEGWRVALTFNVLLSAPLKPALPRACPALQCAMQALFAPPGQSPRTKPWVFLLDHEYSELGCRWDMLKGDDRDRVLALRAAAQANGFVVHLALAEIHEQWSAYQSAGKRQGHRIDRALEELIDSDTSLDFWVDEQGHATRCPPVLVRDSDIASLSETSNTHLVDEEYEGYMGNYGETMDYWYRRAALVIQTQLAAQSSRFLSNFDGALAEVLALAAQGKGAELAERLDAAADALREARLSKGRALLDAYATLAVALPEPLAAGELCDGFIWHDLLAKDVPALLRLEARFGENWLGALMRQWAAKAPALHPGGVRISPHGAPAATHTHGLWPQPLAAFVGAARAGGMSPAFVEGVFTQCQAALTCADQALAAYPPLRRENSLAARLAALQELILAQPLSPCADQHRQALVAQVQTHPALYPLRSLRPVLDALRAAPGQCSGAQTLHAAVVQALRAVVDAPVPADEDMSITHVEWACHCPDCAVMVQWAQSPQANPLTMPMAAGRRTHVEEKIRDAGVPLSTKTLAVGSPHKLVLTKSPDLPTLRHIRRRGWTADFVALTQGSGQ